MGSYVVTGVMAATSVAAIVFLYRSNMRLRRELMSARSRVRVLERVAPHARMIGRECSVLDGGEWREARCDAVALSGAMRFAFSDGLGDAWVCRCDQVEGVRWP